MVRMEQRLSLKKKLGNKFLKQNFLMKLCEGEGEGLRKSISFLIVSAKLK